MNLFETIKTIEELITNNVERFQFLVEQLNTNSTAKCNSLNLDEFVFKLESFQEIAQFLELDFDNQGKQEANVCFANAKDLRYEFKDSFSSQDFLNCLYATLHLENEYSTIDFVSIQKIADKNNKQEIQYAFWQLVEMGSLLRTKIL